MLRPMLVAGIAALAVSPALAKDKTTPHDIYVGYGDMTQCVSMRSTNAVPINESSILFQVAPDETYVNHVRDKCPAATSPFSLLEFSSVGGDACSGDLVRVVDSQTGTTTGACTLGRFERLSKIPAEAQAGK